MSEPEDVQPVEDVLYISLEVGLAEFERILTVDLGTPIPPTMTIADHWPPLASGGQEAIADWLEHGANPGMIVIDPVQPLLSADPSTAQAEVHRLRQLTEEWNVRLVLTTLGDEDDGGVDLLKEAHRVTIVPQTEPSVVSPPSHRGAPSGG